MLKKIINNKNINKCYQNLTFNKVNNYSHPTITSNKTIKNCQQITLTTIPNYQNNQNQNKIPNNIPNINPLFLK
jgi:hypothetical protein